MHFPSFKIIQQWDYYTKTWPSLRDESLISACTHAGITSLQSYVYWASVEREQNVFDFRFYDEIITLIKRHHLKWTPFLIAGPAYAVPLWFHRSCESIYASCLEHGVTSRIQSIWNPFLLPHVERFLAAVAHHFDHTDIESIVLGISGNWGEALYPACGGFPSMETPFHTHQGLWCNDAFARDNFRSTIKRQYTDIQQLNERWETSFCAFDEIDFPASTFLTQLFSGSRRWFLLSEAILNRCSWAPVHWLREQYVRHMLKHQGGLLRHMIDTTNWYIQSMNAYVQDWLNIARRCFPHNEIFIATGGDGDFRLGADFTSLTKAVNQFGAGVRITNQTDRYGESCVLTRWVSSASKIYGVPFITEEALLNSKDGITMRLFDAATSGASGMYCKGILNVEPTGHCEFSATAPGNVSDTVPHNLSFITHEQRSVGAAILLPTTTLRCLPYAISLIYSFARRARHFFDWDFICEEMIRDGALNQYRFLVIAGAAILSRDTSAAILGWQQRGGIVVMQKRRSIYDIHGKHFPLHANFTVSNSPYRAARQIACRIWGNKLSGDILLHKGVYYSIFDSGRMLLYSENNDTHLRFSSRYRRYEIFIRKGMIHETKAML